jgi:predicted RNA polymerase sigma factor
VRKDWPQIGEATTAYEQALELAPTEAERGHLTNQHRKL